MYGALPSLCRASAHIGVSFWLLRHTITSHIGLLAIHPCHYIQRADPWLEQLELRTRDLAQHIVEFEGHREHGYRL